MSKIVGNWVDRLDFVEPIVGRVLGHTLGMDAADERLIEHILAIRGLVEADASEVHVACYVRPLYELFSVPEPDPRASRTLGIALWHIVKVALVRDQAKRRIDEVVALLPPQPTLAQNLIEAGAETQQTIRK
ncbi:MAG: hypothetical protein ABJB66_16685 [Gemmatimonadaceae bacterium]